MPGDVQKQLNALIKSVKDNQLGQNLLDDFINLIEQFQFMGIYFNILRFRFIKIFALYIKFQFLDFTAEKQTIN